MSNFKSVNLGDKYKRNKNKCVKWRGNTWSEMGGFRESLGLERQIFPGGRGGNGTRGGAQNEMEGTCVWRQGDGRQGKRTAGDHTETADPPSFAKGHSAARAPSSQGKVTLWLSGSGGAGRGYPGVLPCTRCGPPAWESPFQWGECRLQGGGEEGRPMGEETREGEAVIRLGRQHPREERERKEPPAQRWGLGLTARPQKLWPLWNPATSSGMEGGTVCLSGMSDLLLTIPTGWVLAERL